MTVNLTQNAVSPAVVALLTVTAAAASVTMAVVVMHVRRHWNDMWEDEDKDTRQEEVA